MVYLNGILLILQAILIRYIDIINAALALAPDIVN